MDAKEKNALVKKLLDTEDDTILDQVKALLEDDEDKDFWDELPEHVKESIQRGKEQAERSEVRPHEKVMAEIRSKYLKK
jgi:predicted transcriptional regulator